MARPRRARIRFAALVVTRENAVILGLSTVSWLSDETALGDDTRPLGTPYGASESGIGVDCPPHLHVSLSGLG